MIYLAGYTILLAAAVLLAFGLCRAAAEEDCRGNRCPAAPPFAEGDADTAGDGLHAHPVPPSPASLMTTGTAAHRIPAQRGRPEEVTD